MKKLERFYTTYFSTGRGQRATLVSLSFMQNGYTERMLSFVVGKKWSLGKISFKKLQSAW